MTSDIDQKIGARVRLRRSLLKMSQTDLGAAIGLTFQQIQKYERGSNRIGAGLLAVLSRILDVPISFFYDDVEGLGTGTETAALSRHEVRLLRALRACPEGTRQSVLDLVEALAGVATDNAAEALPVEPLPPPKTPAKEPPPEALASEELSLETVPQEPAPQEPAPQEPSLETATVVAPVVALENTREAPEATAPAASTAPASREALEPPKPREAPLADAPTPSATKRSQAAPQSEAAEPPVAAATQAAPSRRRRGAVWDPSDIR